ncbi:MAG: P-II family nitrogen regulator, partial [Deltaproteobacteria bacterium]|nr:P-II family nitrogen regulator [Deltaproteobacteria bacterium]
RLDAAKEALSEIGIFGLTVCDVRGFGRQKGHTEVYRGSEYHIDFLPKLKLIILVDDDRVEDVVASLCQAASTGKMGDGKIFVSGLDEVIRIRTGEAGPDAL